MLYAMYASRCEREKFTLSFLFLSVWNVVGLVGGAGSIPISQKTQKYEILHSEIVRHCSCLAERNKIFFKHFYLNFFRSITFKKIKKKFLKFFNPCHVTHSHTLSGNQLKEFSSIKNCLCHPEWWRENLLNFVVDIQTFCGH